MSCAEPARGRVQGARTTVAIGLRANMDALEGTEANGSKSRPALPRTFRCSPG